MTHNIASCTHHNNNVLSSTNLLGGGVFHYWDILINIVQIVCCNIILHD